MTEVDLTPSAPCRRPGTVADTVRGHHRPLARSGGEIHGARLTSDALLVVDLQRAFDDPSMPRRNNPQCPANVKRLVDHWRRLGLPVVFVRHDSCESGSLLAPGLPGNTFMTELSGEPDLLVSKHVHSAFHGDPDLDGWLRERGVQAVTVCGITTDHCCETTARVACDLGYRVRFVIDATSTFPRRTPGGEEIAADDVARVVAASLHGEFAEVVTADAVVMQRPSASC